MYFAVRLRIAVLVLDAPLWTGDPEIVELAEGLQYEVVDLRVGRERPS